MDFNIKDLFLELENLSTLMLEIIKETDEEGDWVNKVTDLLDKRQALIDIINNNNEKSFSNKADKVEVEQIITSIQAKDKLVAEHFAQQMLFMQEKIGLVKQNKVAQDAYLAIEDQADGWFFDSKK